MQANSLTIEVLGTSLSIKAEEETQYLNALLERYCAAVRDTEESTGLKEPLKVAILTGFLLTEQIHKLEEQLASRQFIDQKESTEAEELTLNLITLLNEALDIKNE
jgi:cell division protein ZapA (FtsZ GTPase activity inhibitor)